MRTYRRGPLLEQAQVFRAGAGQDSEGLRWRDHGHPQRLCAGMGQGEVGMLGTQGALLGAGGPRLPHVTLLAPVLEQASGQKITK